MDILFINRMAAMVRGGGETFDLQIAEELQRMGHRITVLAGRPLVSGRRIDKTQAVSIAVNSDTPNPAGRIDQCEQGNGDGCHFTWHYIRSPYLGWFPWDKVRGGWRIRQFEFRIFERLAVRWVLRNHDAYDIVQICELPYVVSSLKKAGLPEPVVMRLTGPNYEDYDGGVKKADGIIASGTTIATVMKRERPDAVNIPNCVNSNCFRPQKTDFRRDNGIRDADLMLLYVARFQGFKDHETLLNAFALILSKRPHARLVLAGSGHTLGSVKQQIARLGVEEQIVMLNEVKYEDLPRVCAAADIAVIPSIYESFCFAALEAMASALPIVTADNGWVPQLLGRDLAAPGALLPGYREPDDEIHEYAGGLVVPKKNAKRLAEAILYMAGDSHLQKRMGNRNRRVAQEEYDWVRSAQKLAGLYDSIQQDKQ